MSVLIRVLKYTIHLNNMSQFILYIIRTGQNNIIIFRIIKNYINKEE